MEGMKWISSLSCAKLEVAYFSGINHLCKTVNNRDGNLNIFMNEEIVKKKIAVVTGAGAELVVESQRR